MVAEFHSLRSGNKSTGNRTSAERAFDVIRAERELRYPARLSRGTVRIVQMARLLQNNGKVRRPKPPAAACTYKQNSQACASAPRGTHPAPFVYAPHPTSTLCPLLVRTRARRARSCGRNKLVRRRFVVFLRKAMGRGETLFRVSTVLRASDGPNA